MRREANNDRAVTWSNLEKNATVASMQLEAFSRSEYLPSPQSGAVFQGETRRSRPSDPDVIIYLLLNVRDIAVADRRAVRDPISGPKNRDIRIPSGERAGSVAAPRRRATRSRALRRARSNSSSRFLRYPQYDDRSIRRASAMVFLHPGRGPNK